MPSGRDYVGLFEENVQRLSQALKAGAMTELLLWPFVAGLVLTGIHAYFGLHVLARSVVFVDLSLAQVAALGLAVAILAGHPVQSDAGLLVRVRVCDCGRAAVCAGAAI